MQTRDFSPAWQVHHEKSPSRRVMSGERTVLGQRHPAAIQNRRFDPSPIDALINLVIGAGCAAKGRSQEIGVGDADGYVVAATQGGDVVYQLQWREVQLVCFCTALVAGGLARSRTFTPSTPPAPHQASSSRRRTACGCCLCRTAGCPRRRSRWPCCAS